MKVVIACRHGEAYKNLKNIYGGAGSGLTENGKMQVEKMARDILKVDNFVHLPVHIYKSCDRIHVDESAQIIGRRLGVSEIKTDPEFKPIRLGVFDGMSREKQLQLYPEACEAHQKWEKGLIDITESERLIEGAQPALEYYNQLKGFIDSLPDGGLYVLLGTRSDMACISNIFKGQTPAEHMKYKYYNFDYAESQILMEHNNQQQVLGMESVLHTIDSKNRERSSVRLDVNR